METKKLIFHTNKNEKIKYMFLLMFLEKKTFESEK